MENVLFLEHADAGVGKDEEEDDVAANGAQASSCFCNVVQVAKVGWAEQHSRLLVQLAMPPPALHGNGSLLFSWASRCMVGAWLL